MKNNKFTGRPTKAFKTADGTEVPGLYRRPGTDVYRVKVGPHAGKEYTESDERLALIRYRKLTAGPADVVTLPGKPTVCAVAVPIVNAYRRLNGSVPTDGKVSVGSTEFWTHVRECLLTNPLEVAQRTGIAQLASFADMDLPGPSIKLADLLDLYVTTKAVKPATARKTAKAVKELVKVTGATTLRDLTTDVLKSYRKTLVGAGRGSESMRGRFMRVKAVIGFGKEDGMNTAEIDACLSRCKVLKVAERNGKKALPNPVSPEQFRKLVAGASVEMRAVLLLSLNACLYLSECLAVEWKELDLAGGFFVSERSKTGVVRAATLWPETIQALKALPRRGESPYVWTSKTGTAFNTNSFRDKFNRLCDAVGVGVEFNSLRDGSYTASCAANVPFHLAQIVAGHNFPGQSNDYIQRNPGQTKTATDAVYGHYSPFPDSTDVVKIGRPQTAS